MLLEYLFETDPFVGFPLSDFKLEHSGFRLPEKALSLVEEIKPTKLIEVGTWKGNSALYMADKLAALNVPFELVCVDTWLGSSEMWIKETRHEPERYIGLSLHHGYPMIYYQFLANVIHKQYQRSIIPFPATSDMAYTVLKHLGYTVQFVYIDGSHDAPDVSRDLANYWKLLEPGGIMCGDDLDLGGVETAVQELVASTGCKLDTAPEEFSWWIKKM